MMLYPMQPTEVGRIPIQLQEQPMVIGPILGYSTLGTEGRVSAMFRHDCLPGSYPSRFPTRNLQVKVI
jgi:hypothetical protein